MMDPDTNTFRMVYDLAEAKRTEIPFRIGEEIEIKGHIFSVELVDIPKNPAKPHLLVLRPLRAAMPHRRDVLKATADMADPPLA
jgi:hypothetical protein